MCNSGGEIFFKENKNFFVKITKNCIYKPIKSIGKNQICHHCDYNHVRIYSTLMNNVEMLVKN